MLDTLDETDFRILKLLQEDARLTNKEIGEKLHKSASPINQRIRKMKDKGIIKGYVVVLDHQKIGLGLVAFTQIQIRDHLPEHLLQFAEAVVKLEEVLECYQIAGDYDFLLKIAAKDPLSYSDLLLNKIYDIVPLGGVQTKFILQEEKRKNTYPLDLKRHSH